MSFERTVDHETPPRLPPAQGRTRLIDQHDDRADKALLWRYPQTLREETDAVGAMRRGLKEYLEQSEKVVLGSVVKFHAVFEEWATSEDQNVDYPSAAVLMPGDGAVAYEAHNLSPTFGHPNDGDFDRDDKGNPDTPEVVLGKVAEAATTFSVEAHCSSPGQRTGVTMLLEDVLNPVHWMFGFRLWLPHYFGQKASFQTTGLELPDDAASARHGARVVRAKIRGSVSVVRPFQLGLLRPRVELQAITSDGSFTEVYPPAGRLRP